MIKGILFSLILTGTFYLGFGFKSMQLKHSNSNMSKVTGIGGIFFKCKDPKKITEWYQKHLGLNTNPYGASFEWFESADSTKKAQTQWTPFSESTKYFEPSTKDFMINYRVENLQALYEEFKRDGVKILDQIETYEYGKFLHILDEEGNKIQLWEPID